jgi:hypothetical protein
LLPAAKVRTKNNITKENNKKFAISAKYFIYADIMQITGLSNGIIATFLHL